jgi:hypothetical protein
MESHLGNFIGKVVLFRVAPQFLEEAKSILQVREPNPLFYGRLLAIDGIGCWVENKSWTSTDAKTHQRNTHLAHILIPWSFVLSAAAFPEREFENVLNDEEAKSIGFHAKL